MNNDLTLDGGGTIVLNPSGSSGNAVIQDLNGGPQALITNVDNTFRGAGNLGNNVLGLINQAGGLVSADVAGGTLTLDPGATNGFTNSGTFEARNGGTLLLTGTSGGDFDNTGGLILADGIGSVVRYTSNSTVTGGTLRGTNGGVHTVNASINAFFSDATIDTGTTFNVSNNADGEFTDGLTNRGTIELNPGGNNARLGLNNDLTLDGGGTIALNPSLSSGNAIIQDLNGGPQALITNVDNTFRGAGNLGNNVLGLINQAGGLVSADVSGGTLTVDPGVTHDFTNAGTFEARNGGTLLFTGTSGGDVENTGGLILADGAGSEAQYRTSIDVTGGTLRSTNGGLHRVLASQTVGLINTTLDTGSSLTVDNNADLLITGSLTNRGTLTLSPGGNNADLRVRGEAFTLDGGGTVVLAASGSSGNAVVNDGDGGTQGRLTNVDNTIRGVGNLGGNLIGITNEADGTILAEGGTLTIDPGVVPVDGLTGFINHGTVTSTTGAVLNLSGSGGGGFENAAGGLLEIEAGSVANISGNFSHRQNAAIEQLGDLNITGGTFTNESDAYSPGTVGNVNTVNVTGTFTNDADAVITFDIDSATEFDQIAGTGTFNLAGGLDINLNFTPEFYESIELISDTSGSGVNGEFDELLFSPIVGVGEALAITYRVNSFNQANAVLLTRALYGDANLNGTVEQADLDAVLTNWGGSGVWQTGDFNGNGTVEQADLDAVLTNWGSSLAPSFEGFSIPEPASALGLIGLAALRRRRRSA
ncbi:MAG: hypothetical protein AAF916_10815 [Planctomycetota bacterium]